MNTDVINYKIFTRTIKRSEDYIHLKDAISADGNINPSNIERLVILPS